MLHQFWTQIAQMNADDRAQEPRKGNGSHRSLTAADGVRAGPGVIQVSYCDGFESICVICAICVQLLSLCLRASGVQSALTLRYALVNIKPLRMQQRIGLDDNVALQQRLHVLDYRTFG